MAGKAHIEVEGLKELQAAIKRQQGKLPAALGQAHKDVGAFVISRLPPGDPHAVGAGTGASVRPSASKREVLLRAGHSGRPPDRGSRGGVLAQWGKREVQPFVPGRPYIVQTVQRHQAEIEQKFLDEMVKVLGPAFFKAE